MRATPPLHHTLHRNISQSLATPVRHLATQPARQPLRARFRMLELQIHPTPHGWQLAPRAMWIHASDACPKKTRVHSFARRANRTGHRRTRPQAAFTMLTHQHSKPQSKVHTCRAHKSNQAKSTKCVAHNHCALRPRPTIYTADNQIESTTSRAPGPPREQAHMLERSRRAKTHSLFAGTHHLP